MAGLKYWVWLNECRGLTNRSRALLLDHFGSPEDVYYADEAEYALVEGLSKKQFELLADKSTDGADKILGDCQRLGLRILTMQDADYPARLRGIFEPPCLLYVKGTLPAFDEEVAVAMVGTRACTPYGTQSAEKIAYGLAKQGALVVSGAARGIDSAAHRGALRAGGVTVAVLGNGLDVVYPEENAGLYRDIAATGALLSEYPPGTAAEGWHFPIRNRIISGLSVATVIVEAGNSRSGALITARHAIDQGRGVYAVPGAIGAQQSKECNALIEQGEASLLNDPKTLVREYGALLRGGAGEYRSYVRQTVQPKTEKLRAVPKKTAAAPKKAAPPEKPAFALPEGLDEQETALVRLVAEGIHSMEELVDRTGLPAPRLMCMVTSLEMEGVLERDAANVRLAGQS